MSAISGAEARSGSRFWAQKRTIRAFSSDSLRAYHQRLYRPEHLTITAAGSLRHDDLLEVAERHIGRLAAGGEKLPTEAPSPSAPLVLKSRRSLQQVQLCLGTPMHPATHPLRFACYTLNVVLGGGMSSRLFQNIRERQGLAYSISSDLNLYNDAGMLAVYAGGGG